MLDSLKSWLTPPDLHDEDQNRLAQYLHTILLTSTALILIYIAANIVTGKQPFSLLQITTMGLVLYLAGLLYLLRLGYLRPVSLMLLIGGWFAFTYIAWISDGVRDMAVITYVVIILMASLLLGWRTALLVALFSIAAVFFFAYAENTALMTPTEDRAMDVARDLSLIFILVVVLNRLLINTLSTALERIKQTNRALQTFSNELENRVIERTQVAELARQQAEAARREAETARMLIETQMWFTNGQAELNTLLRGEQDVITLAQQVIQQLCRYLDAPMGAIFVREGGQFHLQGSYAYTLRQKARTFHFGEGLVGEVASDQRALLIDNVPPDYLHLATSTGDLQPQRLFLHPLVYQGDVVGVVEIATFKPWTPRQSGFLNSVAESIAIAFHTAQTRSRIDELLMETQQQAEELQAQEEELRAANEEWEVQTESLRSSIIEWQQEKKQLEATIAELKKQNALFPR